RLLVEGNSDDENPVPVTVDMLERGERLPDPVRCVADVNDREGILSDSFETAGPARLAEPGSHGGLIARSGVARPRALQPAQKQGGRNRGIVKLEAASQGDIRYVEAMIAKREVEALAGRRDGFIANPDFIADEQAFDIAVAVILDNVWPQVTAVFAIDDGAPGGAGVAFVGHDEFHRTAEQFDMFVVDRGDRGDAATEQTYRVVAAANAGL